MCITPLLHTHTHTTTTTTNTIPNGNPVSSHLSISFQILEIYKYIFMYLLIRIFHHLCRLVLNVIFLLSFSTWPVGVCHLKVIDGIRNKNSSGWRGFRIRRGGGGGSSREGTQNMTDLSSENEHVF